MSTDRAEREGKAVEVDHIQPSAEALPIIEDALARYSNGDADSND